MPLRDARPIYSTADINRQLGKMPVERGMMFPLTTFADGTTRYDPDNGSIIGDAIRAFLAPSRVARGQIPKAKLGDEAANFALSFGLGGLLAGRPKGSLGMGGRPVSAAPERSLDDLGYYSQALEAARSWNQSKGTPEQALMWLKKSGVKDAEIEATGLRAAIEGKPSITRDEIVAHLEANRVRLNEVVNERDSAGNLAFELSTIEETPDGFLYGSTGDVYPTRAEAEAAATSLAMDMADGMRSQGRYQDDTKWSGYSLDPDNPSYRETVLHLPEDNSRALQLLNERKKLLDEKYTNPARPDVAGYAPGRTIREQLAAIDAEKSAIPDPFSSGHFPEPNIVGHMMTSMVKHDGKPTYLIDQIQSDWGQKLRDGGVRDEAKIAELKAKLEELEARRPDDSALPQVNSENAWQVARMRDAIPGWKEWSSQRRLIDAELRTAEAATPGHPLVNTTDQWVNTTLRRALRQAADDGAEYIAIPSGDTVLGYNPGDAHGMNTFYNQIVPKNLAGILKKYGYAGRGDQVPQLDTPTQGMMGKGFTVFPLAPEVKEQIKRGVPLFSNPSTAAIPSLLSPAGTWSNDREQR